LKIFLPYNLEYGQKFALELGCNGGRFISNFENMIFEVPKNSAKYL
jgi:hypothetical protein